MEAKALHWPEYLAEAGLLGLFMIVACILGVALDHPASVAVRRLPDPFVRRALFGLAMGATTFEAPISGMSMNPARSLGSALVAGEVGALWVYLLAPPLGMLLAAAAMRRRAGS